MLQERSYITCKTVSILARPQIHISIEKPKQNIRYIFFLKTEIYFCNFYDYTIAKKVT